MDEARLIERIACAIPSQRAQRRAARRRGGARGQLFVPLGIGDDAAVLSPGGRGEWVVSCDAFIEGIHFWAKVHPAESVGYKALARATSDLAAMGATPRFFLLSLALPAGCAGAWLDGFLTGMRRAALRLGMSLIGGDTTRSASVCVSVTVLGEVAPGRAVTRSGARPGDIIYVSGRLGRAELGLRLLKNLGSAKRMADGRDWRRVLEPHLYPKVRVELGAWLARNRVASAMMDLSDGLSTDLARLCATSHVGARIWAERIPCVDARAFGEKLDPLRLALHGGEDYELLFTVPRRLTARLRKAPSFEELTAIGEIVRGKRILLVDAAGRERRLDPRGWDPFRKRS